jgi:hypothetical protein
MGHVHHKSWGSAVRTVSGLRAGESVARISVQAREYLSPPKHPSSIQRVPEFFSGGNAAGT